MTFLRSVVPAVDRDGRTVIAAAAVRSLDYGFLSVFLGVYLSQLDFSASQAGPGLQRHHGGRHDFQRRSQLEG